MGEKRKKKLIIAKVVIAVVCVITLVPLIEAMIGRTNHEPYIRAESYDELKNLFSEKKEFLFPDEWMEKSIYHLGQAELYQDEIGGYFFIVTNINESDFEYILVSGFYTEYFYEHDIKPTIVNTIYVEGVEVTEKIYENIDADNVISYELQFQLGAVKYSIESEADLRDINDSSKDIYSGNQELVDIARMIIEQYE